jgi:hypothetical protein
VELWEIEAREAARDLVARYNANGDTGRFNDVMAVLADDAVMDTNGTVYTGVSEIINIFTGARDRQADGGAPQYLRHMTATHQIDVVDADHAKGRCYYQVLTAVGLDHWGRYIDTYKRVNGVWKFATRKVTIDGRSPNSTFLKGA